MILLFIFPVDMSSKKLNNMCLFHVYIVHFLSLLVCLLIYEDFVISFIIILFKIKYILIIQHKIILLFKKKKSILFFNYSDSFSPFYCENQNMISSLTTCLTLFYFISFSNLSKSINLHFNNRWKQRCRQSQKH